MGIDRKGFRSAVLMALLVLAPFLEGQTSADFDTEALTVRQVWDNLTTLYGTGHTFTAEEFREMICRWIPDGGGKHASH